MSALNSHKTLFIQSLPYSGSTVLVRLFETSKNASVFSSQNGEGQMIPEIRPFMRYDSWKEDKFIPWDNIKKIYEKNWDLTKPVLVEKSPPNIIHTKILEEKFENPHFIIMCRNPYAWCRGVKRRTPERTFTEIAAVWLERTRYLKFNVNNLKQFLFFTYEEFTDSPEKVTKKIIEFIPELNDIDPKDEFEIHSMLGRKKRPITNFNSMAIEKLSKNDISEISNVLSKKDDILKFFKYEIMS